MPVMLSNEQYDQIMYSYQQNRLRAEDECLARQREAYQVIPTLREIDKKISSLAIESARKSFDEKDKEALHQELSRLSDSKISLLLSQNYPIDYLKVKYTCPLCNDTGFIDGERCDCFKKKIVDTIYSDSMWQRIFKTESFDTFDLSLYSDDEADIDSITGSTPRQSAKDSKNRALDFVRQIKQPEGEKNSMIITGNTGTGKTFLCNCIAGALVQSGYFVVYLSAGSLVEIFERVSFTQKSRDKDFSPGARDFNFSNLYDCDLLIIDDLGTEYANDFTKPKIFDVLNKRLNDNLPSLISTNLDSNRLVNTYSERVISRIMGRYNWIRLGGEDIRLKKRFKDK